MELAVIFDMDGVMIDTERIFVDLWCEILQEYGYAPSREVAIHCIGLDHVKTYQYMCDQMGDNFPCMEIMRKVNDRSSIRYHTCGIPVKEGLYDLLDYLDQRKIPYAVATSTKADNARFRLKQIGVYERLSALITGDMVTNGKPAPDIFLSAADALCRPAEACIVLEDSPHGILAAKRAGCRPVMIPDLKQPDAETQKLCEQVFQNLKQVRDYLENLDVSERASD